MTSVKLPFITDRLIVRDFTPEDMAAILEIVTHPDFTGYLPFRPQHAAEDTRAYIDNAVKGQIQAQGKDRNSFHLAIVLPDGTVVGGCAFLGWNRASNEIGYFIHPLHQGRGYATEALKALVSAFGAQYPERPVHATVHPQNMASQKVLEKLGFRQDGHNSRDVWGEAQPRLKYVLENPGQLP